MKKILFFILLAATLVAASWKGYVISMPLLVSFNIEAERELNLEVKYTSKVGEEFRAEIGTFHKIPVGKSHQQIQLPIGRVYKLRIDPGENPGRVVISDILLCSGDKKLLFNDFTQFGFMNVARKSFDGGRLELYSDNIDPYFWWLNSFKLKAQKKLDWSVLGIVGTLASMISFAVVSFVANHIAGKSTKDKSTFVFCSVFCLLLLVPIARMDKREIAHEENRKLAAFPSLILPEKKGLNYQFGKEFDAWMQDRFTARRSFIKRYENVLYQLNGRIENKLALMTKDKWMFYKPWVEGIQTPHSEHEISRAISNLKRLQEFCDINKIHLFVLICPIKEDIYAEKNPQRKQYKYDKISLIKNDFVKNGINIIYPREELFSKRNDDPLLAFKSDTHLTEFGGYLVHKSFVEEAQKTFHKLQLPNLEEFSVTQNNLVRYGDQNPFGTGHNSFVLKLEGSEHLNYNYNYYMHKINTISSSENNLLERTFFNKNGVYDAILLGDSYTEIQSVWMQHSFRNLIKIRINNGYENNLMRMDRWNKHILQMNPDMLIICVNAHDAIYHFNALYKD